MKTKTKWVQFTKNNMIYWHLRDNIAVYGTVIPSKIKYSSRCGRYHYSIHSGLIFGASIWLLQRREEWEGIGRISSDSVRCCYLGCR